MQPRCSVSYHACLALLQYWRRQDARIRLGTQHAISRILSATARPDEAMPQVLGSIGGGFGWDVGLFWRDALVWDSQMKLRGCHPQGAIGRTCLGEGEILGRLDRGGWRGFRRRERAPADYM